MIVLLNCLGGLLESSAQSTYPSTGGLDTDSVLVSYNELRSANAKMIELKYTKEINAELHNIISDDSILINNKQQEINYYKRKTKRYKHSRNIATGGFVVSLFLFICAIL